MNLEPLAELMRITPQRPLFEVAAKCDVGFTDRPMDLPINYEIVDDPLASALWCSRIEGKMCLVVIDKYYLQVPPDARAMQAMRLHQLMRERPE